MKRVIGSGFVVQGRAGHRDRGMQGQGGAGREGPREAQVTGVLLAKPGDQSGGVRDESAGQATDENMQLPARRGSRGAIR